MQYIITPYVSRREEFAYWDGLFSDEELDVLQQKAQYANSQGEAGHGGEGSTPYEIRSCNVSWWDYNEESSVYYDKLSHCVSCLNANHFGFDLTGFGEPLQLTSYDSSKQDHYTWHTDFRSNKVSRKLSVVVQLSNPDEYEGGELELNTGVATTKIERKRGLITVFPSWLLHRVTPVTKGKRQSLVVWTSGPEFR